MNKREDLVTFIAGDVPDIIMITEVIPKAQINPIEVQLLQLESYDYNYREIDWENESSNEKSERCSTFVDTIQDCFLHQHVTEPTRYRHGEEPSLLDLVLSNEDGMVYNLAQETGLERGII